MLRQEKNQFTSFFNRKLTTLPNKPGNAFSAFLARSNRKFDNLTSTFFTTPLLPLGGVEGVKARIIVEIVIPIAVIRAPIVKPSRLNNSFNLSLNGRVSSLMIVFIRFNWLSTTSL